jgi:lipopolysaccharide/colanic/teichoic acid biosynthesis glycosyltransferase
VFDLLVASAALLVLAPLLLCIAVAVKLDSRGPALFAQRRVGRNGVPFTIRKFRTMVVGADQLGPNISPTTDPRITRVGRLLRRSYLDELPQLWNVVVGEMSLVGPRPETPEFVARYTPADLVVLSVRPGLVGGSTLSGMDEEDELARAADPVAAYIEVIMPRRIAADLSYLADASLPRDVGVLLRQVWLIVRRLW